VVAPPALENIDLLAVWRTTSGVTLNLPGFTIWRIHIKISINFTLSPLTFTANSGVMIAMFVDSINQVLLNPVTAPYDEKYLMWDELYAAEPQVQSHAGTTPPLALYHEYDIRSHRKLDNVDDTLFLQLATTGNVVISDLSFTQSTLVKVP